MTNSKILFDNLVHDLKMTDSAEEIKAIVFLVLGYFGISRTDILSQKQVDFDFAKLKPIVERLNKHEPLQYILNEAWFYGHRFFVNPSVLIPRPETELLVAEAVKFIPVEKEFSILDIGTGSGCIAISLALQFPKAKVMAIDVSEPALSVAMKNAETLGANVDFIRHNILEEMPGHQKFDLIVSNPPYISVQEKNTLPKNVVEFEPHLALFAHENDPLIFYRAIATVSNQVLRAGSKLMVEINERFAYDVGTILLNSGLTEITIMKDLSGKDRLVIATRY